MDIYKLFSKEELTGLSLEEVKQKTDEALLFDAYREQENHLAKYKKNQVIEGLENVLYLCPHCGGEYTMTVKDGSTIVCGSCGFAQRSDEFGFLHKTEGPGEEIRYVSDWSRQIYQDLKEKLADGREVSLTAETQIHMIDDAKNKFRPVGHGTVSLSKDGFRIEGQIRGEAVQISVPIGNLPTLPFSPGKHLEVQHGPDIYRCVLTDGKLVMKYINMVKIFYELNKMP